VQADVDEVRRDGFEVGEPAGAVGDAERDAGVFEEPQERGVVEGLVPHLERVAKRPVEAHVDVGAMPEAAVVPSRERGGRGRRARQEGEERPEPRRVEPELRRELPQDRPELLVEREHARGEEVGERRRAVAELLVVRDEAAAFHREYEVIGRLGVPAPIARRPLQRIERAVDLDALEPPAGVVELLCLGQAERVEDPSPRRVAPPRDADADGHAWPS